MVLDFYYYGMEGTVFQFNNKANKTCIYYFIYYHITQDINISFIFIHILLRGTTDS